MEMRLLISLLITLVLLFLDSAITLGYVEMCFVPSLSNSTEVSVMKWIAIAFFGCFIISVIWFFWMLKQDITRKKRRDALSVEVSDLSTSPNPENVSKLADS